ncbi:clp protease adapter protein ClpF, chloroplastic [Henckelia pumila]|uniref:clp protease adapter protein ClpF, chloroplastic n=1 Tax=Henckelia pumila TaxID=405737 RepID=UPI003C6E2427
MVRSMFTNALAPSSCVVTCGLNEECRRNLGQVKEPRWFLGFGGSCLCSSGGRASYLGAFDIPRPGSWRVGAGWLFKGGDKGANLDASCEQSESANEDILMFFFELDLATRVQYAMNLEQYDIAKQLRNKLTEVESEVIKLRENKRGPTAKSEAQDMAISILRLRAELQNAIQSEKYDLAADLRDKISKLEAESLAASVKARVHENAQYSFRLGQRVKHKLFGYRAVICGMDPVCCESKSWMEGAKIDKLTRGPDQPFYQVLVDAHEDRNLLVAYVPEENLFVPEKRDKDTFDHPYASFLFYGMDGAGDFIPIKQLREKYSQPRHELPYNPQDEDDKKDA